MITSLSLLSPLLLQVSHNLSRKLMLTGIWQRLILSQVSAEWAIVEKIYDETIGGMSN